jgi:hypothetical protein
MSDYVGNMQAALSRRPTVLRRLSPINPSAVYVATTMNRSDAIAVQ